MRCNIKEKFEHNKSDPSTREKLMKIKGVTAERDEKVYENDVRRHAAKKEEKNVERL